MSVGDNTMLVDALDILYSHNFVDHDDVDTIPWSTSVRLLDHPRIGFQGGRVFVHYYFLAWSNMQRQIP